MPAAGSALPRLTRPSATASYIRLSYISSVPRLSAVQGGVDQTLQGVPDLSTWHLSFEVEVFVDINGISSDSCYPKVWPHYSTARRLDGSVQPEIRDRGRHWHHSRSGISGRHRPTPSDQFEVYVAATGIDISHAASVLVNGLGAQRSAQKRKYLCRKCIKQGDYSSSVRLSTRSKSEDPLLGPRQGVRIILKKI